MTTDFDKWSAALAAHPVPLAPEPLAYGMLKPDGTLECDLVGTKGDCEFWARAEGERQHGWAIVPLYAAVQRPAIEDRARLDWLEAYADDFHNIDRITAVKGRFNRKPSLREAIDAAIKERT